LNYTNPSQVDYLLREMQSKSMIPNQETAEVYFSAFIANDLELTFSKVKSWYDSPLSNAIDRIQLGIFILKTMLQHQKSQ